MVFFSEDLWVGCESVVILWFGFLLAWNQQVVVCIA